VTNLYAILAVIAVGILAVTEILVSIQKAQMKKQFLEELDRRDKKINDTDFETK